MSHKTLIAGTAREVTGGKTLVGGTGYEFASAKTLIGGAGKEIGFGPEPLVLYTAGNSSVANGTMGLISMTGIDYITVQFSTNAGNYSFGSNYLQLTQRATSGMAAAGGAIRLSSIEWAKYNALYIATNKPLQPFWSGSATNFGLSELSYITPTNGVVTISTVNVLASAYLFISGQWPVNITKIWLE